MNLKTLYYYIKKCRYPGNFIPPGECETFDDFTNPDNKLDKWHLDGFDYGNFQLKSLHVRYKSSCIVRNTTNIRNPLTNCLNINSLFDPYFVNNQHARTTIPYASGLMRSKKKYRYGYFEASIAMPNSPGAHTGFWLYGQGNGYYREIDIVEGYSGNNQNYSKWGLKDWKLQSNVWWGEKSPDKKIRAKSHPLCQSAWNFNLYGLLWLPDRMQWYYNRRLVRSFKDKEVLDLFDKEMEIVLNLNIERDDLKAEFAQMGIQNVIVWNSD